MDKKAKIKMKILKLKILMYTCNVTKLNISEIRIEGNLERNSRLKKKWIEVIREDIRKYVDPMND